MMSEDFFARIKNFLGKIWLRTRKVADIGAQIASLHLKLAEAERERTLLVKEIGEKVYELYLKGELDREDLSYDLNRIKELDKKINKLNKDIKALKKKLAETEESEASQQGESSKK